MVLLSSIARRAPATPSFSAGCSTSDNFDLMPALAEIADADLDRVGRERVGGHEAQADRTDQPSDHGSSLTLLLA